MSLRLHKHAPHRIRELQWAAADMTILCACERRGFTPLHCACVAGSTACCEALCEGGANTQSVNNEAKLPADYCPGNAAIAAVLADWT